MAMMTWWGVDAGILKYVTKLVSAWVMFLAFICSVVDIIASVAIFIRIIGLCVFLAQLWVSANFYSRF